MTLRLGLRLRIFLFFAALAAGWVAAVAGGLWAGWSRAGMAGDATGFVLAGVIAGFAGLGLVAWVWYLFDSNVARPVEAVASALRARAHTDMTEPIDAALARYLGDLAPAARAAARSLAETRNALAEAVARETERLGAEKARIESILADVPVGVLSCSGDHQIVFYNGAAADLIGGGGGPGLDRSLFRYLREGPVRHAWERLNAAGDPDAVSDLMAATVEAGRILAARMRLVQGGGYVLTLRDMSAELAAHARMEALLAETLDRVRRPAANLSALLEAAEPGAATFARVERALREEVATLAAAVTDIARRHDRARAEDLPLAQTRASDLADGLGARLAAAGLFLSVATEPLLLRCNGFDIIDLLAAIAERMAAAGLARSFHLAIEEEDSGAAIRLGWAGPALPIAQLDRWLDEAADPALPAVRRRAVLRAHATEIWPERRGEGQVLCLPVPRARRETGRPAPLPRRLVYDFDLLAKARHDSLAESTLEDLTYVVFDTETTGLLPRQGDAIVQIAAVRIVNGRRVAGEVFDTLVNPGRPIPAAATAVHGITGAMVEGAPRLPEAARRFHRFAEGAVLIAHNAPFDMAFLRRAEGQIGLRFDMPILDTVLLSAVLYGRHEVHSLDALAHRLGITIPEEARHTALGDAVATADAFLRMMPMLRGRGLCTFGAVLAEVRRHGRLLRDLNLGS